MDQDAKPVPLSKSLSRGFREAAPVIGTVGTAFGIFQNFDAFLSFCTWVRSWLSYWEAAIHVVWNLIGRLFQVPIPEFLELFLTTWLFFMITVISSLAREEKPSKSTVPRVRPGFWKRTLAGLFAAVRALPGAAATIIVFMSLLMAMSWKNMFKIGEFIGNVPPYKNIMLLAFVGPIMPIMFASLIFSYGIDMVLLARRCFRIIVFVAILIVINYIGLYADAIRAGGTA